MPAPNPSNRERLLRLIDGGTEALKEMQTDEPAGKITPVSAPPAAKKNEPPLKLSKLTFDGWKTKLSSLSGPELLRFGKWVLLLGAVVAMLHYGLEMIKSMKSASKLGTIPASASAVPEEEGVGLRLVGVDSSDASPVALLEDLKTGKTYFARVNEKVKDARVKQIQKNKVVVSYHGKNLELR